MGKRLLAVGVALAQTLLLCFTSTAHAEPPSAEDAALLETIITQNDATVKKLESSPLFAEYTWRTTMTLGAMPGPGGADVSGPMVAVGRARFWRDGTSFREDRELTNTWTETGKVVNLDNIFLINDRYAVSFHKELLVLDLYYFDERDNLYPAIKSQVKSYPLPNILEFGTRYSETQSLKEAYEGPVGGKRAGYTWTPHEIKVDGKTRYKISNERSGGAQKKLKHEVTVDPESGFLVSETRAYDKKGSAYYVRQIQLQQVADGIWFPKSATRTLTQDKQVMNIEVQKVSVGGPDIAKAITLEALDIDREVTITYEHSKAGTERTVKGFWDGKWVPLDQLPPERREIIRAAHRKANAGKQSDRHPSDKSQSK